MHHGKERTAPLARTLRRAVVAAVALLVGLPAAAQAAGPWGATAPVGPAGLGTGALSLDQEDLGTGTWTHGSRPFDPADPLPAGTTLTYTVQDVPVTALGDNLTATFRVEGAVVPDALAAHVTVEAAGATVRGADSGADGTQSVAFAFDVTTTADLPDGEHVLDLSDLTVVLTNGRGWADTARLDAGALTTAPAAPPAPGGEVTLTFDLSKDADKTVGFYLDDPGPGTVVHVWGVGSQPAVDGLNEVRPLAMNAQVAIVGTFRGLGSPEQTPEQIGSLREVKGWTDDVGSTSAAHAFHHAQNLVGVESLPSGLTDTSYAFAGASTAESASAVIAPSWQPTAVTNMAHMFDGAGTLGWDVLRGWDTSGVTSMAGMFRGATTFNADIGGWDTSSVTDMTSMFEGAAAFDADLSAWDVEQVQAWADFATGSGLAEEHVPPKFRTAAADAGSAAADAGSAAGEALPVPAPADEPGTGASVDGGTGRPVAPEGSVPSAPGPSTSGPSTAPGVSTAPGPSTEPAAPTEELAGTGPTAGPAAPTEPVAPVDPATVAGAPLAPARTEEDAS